MTLTSEQLRHHRALVLRLKKDGCPPDYISAKTHILKECWAWGLPVTWRQIWML